MKTLLSNIAFALLLSTPVLADDTAPAHFPSPAGMHIPDRSHVEIVFPQDFHWVDGMGAHQALLFGDPNKPGIYGVLIKWDPGHFSRPHFHSTDRYAYVVSGTWWISSSNTYDPIKTFPVPAGSYVRDIANTVHWDGAKDEPCVIMLVGMGPTTTTPVDENGVPLSNAH